MRKLILFVSLLASLKTPAQSDSVFNYTIYDSTVIVSLSSNDMVLSKIQLDTGFTIKLSDTTAKLLHFVVIYFFETDSSSGLQAIQFKENMVIISKEYPKIGLFKDPRSNFITLEHVYFAREGRRFKAKNAIIPIR